jgi:hypothetical protein
MRAVIFVLAICASAHAGVDPQEAQQAKDAAYKAFELSDYDTAIDEYKHAYRLTNDARLFYNLGLSYRKRYQLKGNHADLVEARDYFQRFVTLITPATPADASEHDRLDKMRALAHDYIDELQRELDRASLQQAEPAAPHQSTPERGRTPMILFIGSGVLLVGGSITGVLALRYDRDARDAKALGDVDGTNAFGDKAKLYALATDAMFGTAIVAGGIGLYLALRHPRTSDHQRVSVSVSPVGAALSVRY